MATLTMRASIVAIPDLLVFEPEVHADARGYFFESFNQREFERLTGQSGTFVQDNFSHSVRGVLRGLHYQIKFPQGKLLRAVTGEMFNVAVDLRRSSATFGKWFGLKLSAENRKMLWVPEGFAHGFVTLSGYAECLYKVTNYWAPEHERSILWNDPDLAIDWPVAGEPLLSDRDLNGRHFRDAEVFA
jgi:dTDP-4-dehydrorhamnose 3,5-epimerase